MKYLTMTLIGALVVSTGATMLVADGHADERTLKGAIKARQAHMSLYSHSLGILGAMAKGDVDYDAAAAQAAANDLAAVATLSQAGYWLPGTDSDSMEGTRALPAIWQPDSKAQTYGMEMAEAALAMQAAAGTDLASMQAAMGAVGEGCKSCHEDYRKPR
jgi:cytochrome c556